MDIDNTIELDSIFFQNLFMWQQQNDTVNKFYGNGSTYNWSKLSKVVEDDYHLIFLCHLHSNSHNQGMSSK